MLDNRIQTYVVAPAHGPLLAYTIKLEAHQLQNWISISHGMHNLRIIFKSR